MVLLLLSLACPSPEPTPDSGDPTGSDSSQETGDDTEWLHVLDVGDGHPYAHPNDVPWEDLQPYTQVRIHAGTYAAKWVINSEGPIEVIGIGDVVIDGQDATTRTELDYWNEPRSVLKIGGANHGPQTATDIRVRNLTIRGGMRDHGFTDDGGAAGTYADNAACIHVEAGHDVTLQGNVLTDCGNGLFVTNLSSDVKVLGNHIHGNGVVDSIYEHNSYTEANGILFSHNRYGALRPGALGNNLKDRSRFLTVQYNWIEGGNRQLDLVESTTFTQDLPTCVVGNVLIEGPDDGNSQILHYGGDNGDASTYRTGPLVLVHNTVVSQRSGNTTLMRLSSPDIPAQVWDSVVVAERLAITAGQGQVMLTDNALPPDWRATFEADLDGAVQDTGTLTGDPLLDAGHAPQAGSPLIGAAGALDTPCAAPTQQYTPHQAVQQRGDRTTLGAFEGEG